MTNVLRLRSRQRLRIVKITLASPNDIRSWSFGEVKKPETINYRTYRPRRTGCSASGSSARTRLRMRLRQVQGHEVQGHHLRSLRREGDALARPAQAHGAHQPRAPVVHIWFFKALPSRLGTLLKMKTADLEKVIYFQDYVVIDPGDTELEYGRCSTRTPTGPPRAVRRHRVRGR